MTDPSRRESLDLALSAARMAGALPLLNPLGRHSPSTVLRTRARQHGSRLAVAFEELTYSWSAVDERVNRYAHWLISQGIRRGDVVALAMENRPSYLFALLGLNRVGAVGALVNTNLTGKALAHAVSAAGSRAVLMGAEMRSVVDEALDADAALKQLPRWVQYEDASKAVGDPRAINGLVTARSVRLPPDLPRPRADDVFCYIYTSGTTGLPKAAIVKNRRYLSGGVFFGHMMHRVGVDDVIYVPLPLYHTSAIMLGWGSALATGAGVAIRRKFSARQFWNDVRRHDARSFLYIGELCRYLLNQPPNPEDSHHRLRCGVGNGLRPDIWETFTERFGVPVMREFYGSTEGNAAAFNLTGKPGMVGKLVKSQEVVRCDPDTGEVLRAANGLAERVQPGEAGLLLGRINKLVAFDGYVDRDATQRKILQDVLEPGDRYFNSGDLVQVHPGGWLSFADRLGDTFRWKGENVSTNEVAEILNGAAGVLESNVFGVEVPGSEGRAGMAAVQVGDNFQVAAFAKFVAERLPGYQQPLFLRILTEQMQVTGTFKHQKGDYRKQGFDPASVSDPLYLLRDGAYVPLDTALFGSIQQGQLKL